MDEQKHRVAGEKIIYGEKKVILISCLDKAFDFST